ncbi:DUF2752 domain-containing protein [Cyanobacterium stanieri LEGE 03274]|uniref:DUF2752 domain-containing protein n=1 Tax=Cyanobacterium stanieri LEGE 03274 TaxID=1828756 RepID=A0ABR9V6H4_9CHRO|nr:DUF2752 domain-containing protein [Cyanobacterium stanieri]MBE9223477.1 DUF2752 domain-containing protein [Cyanobacterium stanieri LEGE 03274]
MFRFTTTSISSRGVYGRSLLFLILSSVIVGSYLLNITETESPFSCIILAFTGIPCPGCGLTRSFLAMAGGNIWESFYYHLFGPLLFIIFLVYSLHLFLEIITKKKVKATYLKLAQNKKLQYLILFLILVYYLSKLIFLHSTGELTESFLSSPLANLIYQR